MWPGFSHGLPVAGLGFEMFNRSKKYLKSSSLPVEMKQSWKDVVLGRLLGGLKNRKITADSSRDEVVQAIYRETSPSPFMKCYFTSAPQRISRACVNLPWEVPGELPPELNN
jgi:hypothetical protein